jgi:6-phosphofructokinase 1
MANNMRGAALVAQSGGPTAVINASLVGVLDTIAASSGKVYGMNFGVEGLLEDRLLDLSTLSSERRRALRSTPSSALGSTRRKLDSSDLRTVLERLEARGIRYLFMIGGNDTMGTIHAITSYCAARGYELVGVGIPKTVDNDLYGTDHTPGFASAAWYNVLSVRQAGVLARDMQRVDNFVVYQTVGRDAGWLAAATSAAKVDDEDGPHLIYVPERPFDTDRFLQAAEECVERHGWLSVVCGEGIAYADGTPVSASTTTDSFENVEFGAMGGTSAAFALHRMLSNEFGWRGEFQVTESLPMCAADRVVGQDAEEAYECGVKAVDLALGGTEGVMVTIEVPSRRPYRTSFETIPLSEVARKTRAMPKHYVSESWVTEAFLEYLAPLLPSAPEYVRLY